MTVKVLPTGLNVWLMGSSVDYNRTTGKVRVHDGVSDMFRKVYVPGFILMLLIKDVSAQTRLHKMHKKMA